jgi:hypothetical protein
LRGNAKRNWSSPSEVGVGRARLAHQFPAVHARHVRLAPCVRRAPRECEMRLSGNEPHRNWVAVGGAILRNRARVYLARRPMPKPASHHILESAARPLRRCKKEGNGRLGASEEGKL